MNSLGGVGRKRASLLLHLCISAFQKSGKVRWSDNTNKSQEAKRAFFVQR